MEPRLRTVELRVTIERKQAELPCDAGDFIAAWITTLPQAALLGAALYQLASTMP